MVLVCRRLAQDILEDGFGFWVDSLFEDAVEARWLREDVGRAVERGALQLSQARNRFFYLHFEFLGAVVDWVHCQVNVCKILESFAEVFNARPI